MPGQMLTFLFRSIVDRNFLNHFSILYLTWIFECMWFENDNVFSHTKDFPSLLLDTYYKKQLLISVIDIDHTMFLSDLQVSFCFAILQNFPFTVIYLNLGLN